MDDGIIEIIKWAITTAIGVLGILVGREWVKRDRNIARDIEVLNKLLEILPGNGSILFLRHQYYSDVFPIERLDDLMHFTDASEKPEFSFIDNKLEKLRSGLLTKVRGFRNSIYEKTTNPSEYHVGVMRVKRPDDDPNITKQQVEISLQELDLLADDLVKTYDKLVKTARERL